jgi:hypothetical protein
MSSHPLRIAFVAAALLSLAVPATAETPAGMLGEYRSAPRKVCVPGGGGHRAVCSRSTDVMRIERSGFEGRRDVKVRAEFTLPDSQYCSFEGTGYWNAQGRRLLVTDATSGCELSFSPQGRELRGFVVQPEQCSSPCAGRDWLTGVVLRKRG